MWSKYLFSRKVSGEAVARAVIEPGWKGLRCYRCPLLSLAREYESLYTSHIWIPSSWCSPTQRPECDITRTSLLLCLTASGSGPPWSSLSSLGTLKHGFNQNSSGPSLLTPPPPAASPSAASPFSSLPFQQPLLSTETVGILISVQMSLTKSECYKHRQP